MDDNREILWATTDPQGRRVVLYRDQWFNHVLDHQDLRGIEHDVLHIVNDPEHITTDKGEPGADEATHRRRLRYIGSTVTPSDNKLKLLKTVVEYPNESWTGTGTVVTVHPMRKSMPMEGLKLVYSRRGRQADENQL